MKLFAPHRYRGSSGIPLPVLKTAGIELVINLQTSPGAALQEFRDGLKYGIDVWSVPFCPAFPPKCSVVDWLVRTLREEPKPIYIHCRKGVDRTGYLVAAYRVAQGMSVDDACKEWKAEGRSWWLGWWEFFFRRRCRRLKPA